jgi:hypothetical protein
MRTVLDSLKLTEIFIACDDFCQHFQHYSMSQANQPIKERQMCDSEMMAILIFYHHSGMKCFKYYYEQIICKLLRSYWKKPYAYEAFVAQIPRVNLLLFAFLSACRLATTSEANYIDSTPLVVAHNRRKQKNKTFAGLARTGKTSTGWFFGFKLHAVINQKGQLVIFRITTANVADNNQGLLEKLTERLKGFLYGDKGYLTALADKFKERGLEIITKYRKRMGLKALSYQKHYYLQHRGLIETVFDCLKNLCDIDHSRHRSPLNFFVNIWSALIAYTFFDEFPSITPFRERLQQPTQIVLI